MLQYVVKFQNDSRTQDERGRRHDRWNNGQFNAVDLAQARMIAETIDGASHVTDKAEHNTRAVIFARIHLPEMGLINIPVDMLKHVARAILEAEQDHTMQCRTAPQRMNGNGAVHHELEPVGTR